MVTGASTGIGRATVLWLDARGWRVHAGVRREEDLRSLAESGSDRLLPVLLDVTDQEQIEAAAARVVEDTDGAGLDGLVNNAGIAVPGPLETLPIEDFRRQLEVNLIAQVAVTKAMLSSIRAARGRIVFNTSIGGRMALPMFGAYHASKFGLEAVGDSLRQELRPWGISVSIIEPGSIQTPIWERGVDEGEATSSSAPRRRRRRSTRATSPLFRRWQERRPCAASRREGRGDDRACPDLGSPPHSVPGRSRRARPGVHQHGPPRPDDRLAGQAQAQRLSGGSAGGGERLALVLDRQRRPSGTPSTG